MTNPFGTNRHCEIWHCNVVIARAIIPTANREGVQEWGTEKREESVWRQFAKKGTLYRREQKNTSTAHLYTMRHVLWYEDATDRTHPPLTRYRGTGCHFGYQPLTPFNSVPRQFARKRHFVQA